MNRGPDLPFVTVGAIVERTDGKILVVRTHKWRGRLGLPGGKVERGEPLEAALRREILEETQLSVCDVRFIVAQDSIDTSEFYRPPHMVLMNYHCRTEDVDVRLNDEAEQFFWVTPTEALSLDLNTPTRRLIERWMAVRPGDECGGDCLGADAPIVRPCTPVLAPAHCEALMREALYEAQLGLAEGECPVGCVVARVEDSSPRIVARGHNRVEGLVRKTAHAEIFSGAFFLIRFSAMM